MRKVVIRFPDEESMVEFGKKIGIKHFIPKKANGSQRPRTRITYKKSQNSLEQFFG